MPKELRIFLSRGNLRGLIIPAVDERRLRRYRPAGIAGRTSVNLLHTYLIAVSPEGNQTVEDYSGGG